MMAPIARAREGGNIIMIDKEDDGANDIMGLRPICVKEGYGWTAGSNSLVEDVETAPTDIVLSPSRVAERISEEAAADSFESQSKLVSRMTTTASTHTSSRKKPGDSEAMSSSRRVSSRKSSPRNVKAKVEFSEEDSDQNNDNAMDESMSSRKESSRGIKDDNDDNDDDDDDDKDGDFVPEKSRKKPSRKERKKSSAKKVSRKTREKIVTKTADDDDDDEEEDNNDEPMQPVSARQQASRKESLSRRARENNAAPSDDDDDYNEEPVQPTSARKDSSRRDREKIAAVYEEEDDDEEPVQSASARKQSPRKESARQKNAAFCEDEEEEPVQPVSSRKQSSRYESSRKARQKVSAVYGEEDDDEEEPVQSASARKQSSRSRRVREKVAFSTEDEEEDDEEDEEPPRKQSSRSRRVREKVAASTEDEEEDDDEEPPRKQSSRSRRAREKISATANGEDDDDEDDEPVQSVRRQSSQKESRRRSREKNADEEEDEESTPSVYARPRREASSRPIRESVAIHKPIIAQAQDHGARIRWTDKEREVFYKAFLKLGNHWVGIAELVQKDAGKVARWARENLVDTPKRKGFKNDGFVYLFRMEEYEDEKHSELWKEYREYYKKAYNIRLPFHNEVTSDDEDFATIDIEAIRKVPRTVVPQRKRKREEDPCPKEPLPPSERPSRRAKQNAEKAILGMNHTDDHEFEHAPVKEKKQKRPFEYVQIKEKKPKQEPEPEPGLESMEGKHDQRLAREAMEKDAVDMFLSQEDNNCNQKRPSSRYLEEKDPNPFYVEEVAWRYHDPPLPGTCDEEGEEVEGAVPPQLLRPLPPAPPLPSFPDTGHCQWTLDEEARVLYADFRPRNGNKETICLTEDINFLLRMYERDDVTVVSEGLVSGLDPQKWTLDYIENAVGDEYYHKFRRFDKQNYKIKTTGGNLQTGMDDFTSSVRPSADQDLSRKDNKDRKNNINHPKIDRKMESVDRKMDNQDPKADGEDPKTDDSGESKVDSQDRNIDKLEKYKQDPETNIEDNSVDRKNPKIHSEDRKMETEKDSKDIKADSAYTGDQKTNSEGQKMDLEDPEMGCKIPKKDSTLPKNDCKDPKADNEDPKMNGQHSKADRDVTGVTTGIKDAEKFNEDSKRNVEDPKIDCEDLNTSSKDLKNANKDSKVDEDSRMDIDRPEDQDDAKNDPGDRKKIGDKDSEKCSTSIHNGQNHSMYPNDQFVYVMHCEKDGFVSMKVADYIRYLKLRRAALATKDSSTAIRTFIFYDDSGSRKTLDVIDSVLYMIDYDLVKLLPDLYSDFLKCFKLTSTLPGGSHCMMKSVNVGGRPFMGPNFYMTPPASFTHFHQDGHGTVDSGHYCISGYNEVIMLRRMPERHKKHALYLLTGAYDVTKTYNSPQQPFNALYHLPHGDGGGEKPMWPSQSDIDECKEMNYYPSVFILKPGQLVHINKSRLHAFRKLSNHPVPKYDCHAELRSKLYAENEKLADVETLCVSVAWDWMFRGVTTEGVNREVVAALECAALNRRNGVDSLAIPEHALLQMARTLAPAASPIINGDAAVEAVTPVNYGGMYSNSLIAVNEEVKNAEDGCLYSNLDICKGIYPSLKYVVKQHLGAIERAKSKLSGSREKGKKLSLAKKPNAWENPLSFALDPYGNSDFFCKLCHKELSNIYLHCDGCEILLCRDFNICVECHREERFAKLVFMHPLNQKRHSTINHLGNPGYSRQSRCPCKNGPACKHCSYCAGCSCRCHTWFTLQCRFFNEADELKLLRRVESVCNDESDKERALEVESRLSRLVVKKQNNESGVDSHDQDDADNDKDEKESTTTVNEVDDASDE